VRVTGTAKPPSRMQIPQLDPDDPFYDFFRRFRQPPQEIPTRGAGSGFIVSADGVILTNAHVVDGADTVSVKLSDRREFNAKVLGADKATDVAVLKIDAHDLPVVKLGDVTRERVGEWVVAIGEPFGLENTATAGIISAKARSLPDQGYVRFMQTDVPINPGNSGGPLFNLKGEVIAINSQIYTGTGGYQGVSFAIPINLAMDVEQQLVKNGKVERGQLGLEIQSVSQPLARDFGLEHPSGALISTVVPDGPGERAGLRAGDVILKFNGQVIGDSADLPPLVARVAPGSSASVQIWRDGATHDVSIKVGSSSSDDAVVAGNSDHPAHLGLSLRPLTAEERSDANVSGGLLVEGVSGPAARAGVRPGDIVLAVDNRPVDSVQQLRKLVAQDRHHVALLMQHDDQRIFVPIDLG